MQAIKTRLIGNKSENSTLSVKKVQAMQTIQQDITVMAIIMMKLLIVI